MKPVNIFRLTHEVVYTYSDREARFYYFDKPESSQFLKIDEDTNLEINKPEIYSQKIEKLFVLCKVCPTPFQEMDLLQNKNYFPEY